MERPTRMVGGRDGALDGVEEANELLMAMPSHGVVKVTGFVDA